MPETSSTPFRIEADGPILRSYGSYGAGEALAASAADGRMRERMHVCTCLAVVVSGRFDFRTPSGATIATPGSMIFGHAGEHFSFRYLDGCGAIRAVIALSDELLSEVADVCGSRRFAVAAIPPRRATTALYGLTRTIALAERARESDVYELVVTALGFGRDLDVRRRSMRERRRVRDVARYIDVEYAQPMRLADLAARAQLSKFHFLRAFRDEVGESPGRYLIAARLRAAADRLIATREPIAAIALSVGFNDLSHFNATFRATFGSSPRAWRSVTNSAIT